MVGSLAGAVSSQRVTEEHEGALSMVGNHALRVKAEVRLTARLSVSQSGTLMPLHSKRDFRPHRGYLRAPPLLFGRRPPQSNYPPRTVPDPDHGPGLEIQPYQGGISRTAPRRLASPLRSLPPILHKHAQISVRSCSKGSRCLLYTSPSPRD